MNESSESGGAWRVTGQVEQTGLDSNNRYVPGVRISFTTREGIAGSVFVPDTQYNAEAARAAIAARVAQMAGVHGLNG